MDVLVICRDGLCSKEIIKRILDVTSKFCLCFTFQQDQAPLCQLNLTKVNDGLIDLDRDAKVLLGFLEEKLKTLMYIHFSLLWKFSDQIQNCPILFKKVKDWTLTFQKIGQNFKSGLKSTVMIEANSWKNRRKLLQQSQRNRVV